jgi:hypothetical protein
VNVRKLAVVAATGLALTACSSMSTEPDQSGLQYGAGPIESTHFVTCVKPGNREVGGIFDEMYAYPAGTRTYTFDKPGDRAVVDIADKDGQPLTVAGILTFQLNADCATLQKFHERIGLKYGASSDGVTKWGELLDDYLGQPLRSAMRDAAANYTWRELYSDAAKRTEWENAVKDLLPQYVKDLAQGDFFTHFTLLAQTPQPGGGLLRQIEEQNTQAERLNTIEAQKAAQAAEIDQMRQLVELLGPDGYVLYRNQLNCEDGSDKTACVPFLPLPQGSAINVVPGGK